jgi:hypothetical protein
VQLDPLVLPDDWTAEQAFAVAEFLIALHDAIWDAYGWALRDAGSGAPPGCPALHDQLDLPLVVPGDPFP